MSRFIQKTYRMIDFFTALFFFPVIFIFSWFYRSGKKRDSRICWGPIPLKPIKYNSLALRSYGTKSFTYVYEIYPITNRHDFDFVFYEKIKNKFIKKFFLDYLVFLDILKKSDIFITNFDGGFLSRTRLSFYEHVFWKISRKKVIVWPYGSDTALYTHMHDFSYRNALFKSYPFSHKREKKTAKKIRYFTKHADFIVGNIPHQETIPKWDILTIACYCVDTQEWKPDENFQSMNDGINGPVKIIHCPNHRAVKGTEFLISACREIQEEGYQIELEIIENLKNEKLREIMRQSDIVAAEFLYGYASTEIEGMSLAKPVLSNLTNDYFFSAARRYTYFKECPVYSTNPENLKKDLLILIKDPQLRKKLGELGRLYVEKYHSFEGQGLMWSKIIQKTIGAPDENLDGWWKKRAE